VVIYIDGNELRAAELARIAPGLAVTVEALQSGFSTSAPEPAHRARDKVLAHLPPQRPSALLRAPAEPALAHPVTSAYFAEAVDLTTMDGKSLRLELDSENPNRFCKWWRETPAKMHLAVALRRAPGAEIELFASECAGRIADQPRGSHLLGWDRLFVPAGADVTLAQLIEAGEVSALRRAAYTELAAALRAPARG
jgi:hypothetical protein